MRGSSTTAVHKCTISKWRQIDDQISCAYENIVKNHSKHGEYTKRGLKQKNTHQKCQKNEKKDKQTSSSEETKLITSILVEYGQKNSNGESKNHV